MMDRKIGENKTGEKGYVKDGYHFFYLYDNKEIQIDYHFHSFHKCLLILSGQVTYTVEGRTYKMTAGDVIWIPAYEIHKVDVKANSCYERLIVYLSENFVKLLGSQTEERMTCFGKVYPNCIRLSESKREYYMHNLRKILLDINTKKIDENALRNISGFLLWAEEYLTEVQQIEKQEIYSKEISDKLVKAGMTYIHGHLLEDISIDIICQHLFVSRHHFMRRFKKASGTTVYQYILRERIHAARELMKQNVNLTDIGYQVGFKDYTTFARAFKRVYGRSPREVKKLHPEGNLE